MSTSLKKPKVVSVTDTTTDTTFSLLINISYVFAIVKPMKNILLTLMVFGIVGCATAPSTPYECAETTGSQEELTKCYNALPDEVKLFKKIEGKKKKNDDIAEVVQKGYVLNGRVIKPALVIVIKNTS